MSLTADDVELIAANLKENKVVTDLDLNYNPIGGDGAKVIADALKVPIAFCI
jgi:hypothetical protein